jgi:hypothetical protein
MKLLLIAAVIGLTGSDPIPTPQQQPLLVWQTNGYYFQGNPQIQAKQTPALNWPLVANPNAEVFQDMLNLPGL